MWLKKFPSFKQLDAKDCGPACLQIISKHYGKYFTLHELRERCGMSREGISIYDICKAAENLGFKTLPVKTSYKRLYEQMTMPCVVHWRNSHFIVVYRVEKKKVYVSDPAEGLVTYTKREFVKGWLGHIKRKDAWKNGAVIAFEPTDKFKGLKTKKEDTFAIVRYLMAHLVPYNKQVVHLIMVMVLITAVQSAFPIITQSVVDIGISSKDMNFIHLLLIANVFLVISTSAGTWVRQSINMHIASRLKISLLSNYIMKLLRLPITFFENKLIGDILQRAMDYSRLESFIMNSAFSIILAGMNLIVFGFILALYDPVLLYIFAGGSFIYVVWVLMFWEIRKRMDIKYFALMAQNHSHWIEMLANIQDIKHNNYERGKRWQWEKVQVKLYQVGLKLLNVDQAQQIGSNLVNTLRDVALTFYAAAAVIDGTMTFGMMIATQYIIGQLRGPINEIIFFISSYQMAYISFTRMNEVEKIEEEQDETNINSLLFPEKRTITLMNASFRYNKNHPFVLQNISLRIPEGKVTAIVGESGCVYSTLLKILQRLYKPSIGKMQIGESNADHVSLSTWREKCGVVSQESQIFKETVMNNIILGNHELDKDKFINAVRSANIHKDIEQMPYGYNTLMGENGRGLSAGQKQRVLIARALYKNPDYIFFDEASNALDSKNEKAVIGNLREQYKGKTVIMISHRLSTIKEADQIIVLKDGNIVEKGNHKNLLLHGKHYTKLYEDQLSDAEKAMIKGKTKTTV